MPDHALTIPVAAAEAVPVDPAVPLPVPVPDFYEGLAAEQQRKAMDLAASIRDRFIAFDGALAAYARAKTLWLWIGFDLMRARKIIPQGQWEAWVRNACGLKLSTAENMRRTVEMIAAARESVTVTDLEPYADLQPTILYKLSRESTPKELRDEYLPRILDHDKWAVRQAANAIAKAAEKTKRRSALTDEGRAAAERRDAAQGRRWERDRARAEAEDAGCQRALREAADLLRNRLGDDLAGFNALVARAGRFADDLPRLLRESTVEADPVHVAQGAEAVEPEQAIPPARHHHRGAAFGGALLISPQALAAHNPDANARSVPDYGEAR